MTDLSARLLRAIEWGAVLVVATSCGGETSSDGAGGSSGASGGATTGGGSGGVTTGGGSGGVTTGGGSGGVTTGGSGGLSGATSTGGSGGVIDGGTDAGLPSTPYPEPAGCYGPSYDGGYYGQCCEKVECIAPVGGACPPADQLYSVVPGYPPGSGSCSCGDNKGPFAPHDGSEAACCYLFGSISCDGRPLVVDGRPRVAPLVARTDWATLGLAA